MKDSQVNAEVPPEAAADSAIQLNPGAERTTNLGGKQFHCTTLAEIGDQSFRQKKVVNTSMVCSTFGMIHIRSTDATRIKKTVLPDDGATVFEKAEGKE